VDDIEAFHTSMRIRREKQGEGHSCSSITHKTTREHAAFNNLRTRNSVVGSSALTTFITSKSSHSRLAFWPASARQTGPETRTSYSYSNLHPLTIHNSQFISAIFTTSILARPIFQWSDSSLVLRLRAPSFKLRRRALYVMLD
jgi:hypothetical protein